MGKIHITGQSFLAAILILGGSFLFLWFCWPAVFKGVLNVGNLCGMLGAFLFLLYGIRMRAVNQFIGRLIQKTPARICLAVLALFAFAGLMLVSAACMAILQSASGSIPANTPAIVLGCAVKGMKPSRALQERIDAAYAYMQENPQAICILSGAKGKGEDIAEAECMYQKLAEAGIDPGRMYKETASTDTEENIKNSLKILEKKGLQGKVAIISSEYHLYRGRWWARKSGYQEYGYAAHTDWRYLPTYFLREVVAVNYLWLKSLCFQ